MRLPAGDSPSADEAEAEAEACPTGQIRSTPLGRPALRRIGSSRPGSGARASMSASRRRSPATMVPGTRAPPVPSVDRRARRERQRVHRAGRHQKLDEIRAHRARLRARNTTGLTANVLRPFPAVILRRGGVGRIVRRRRVVRRRNRRNRNRNRNRNPRSRSPPVRARRARRRRGGARSGPVGIPPPAAGVAVSAAAGSPTSPLQARDEVRHGIGATRFSLRSASGHAATAAVANPARPRATRTPTPPRATRRDPTPCAVDAQRFRGSPPRAPPRVPTPTPPDREPPRRRRRRRAPPPPRRPPPPPLAGLRAV